LPCIEIPAALRRFGVVILIRIGVERNERASALDCAKRRARVVFPDCR
jgi:hypothetical protein